MKKYEYIRKLDLTDAELNIMGQDGWECYATTEPYPKDTYVGFRVFFFKREIN